MVTFSDESGRDWIATAREEQTPRHHTRWYLVFQPPGDSGSVIALPEIRWQTHETAERTLRTMSLFELRRRLAIGLRRAAAPDSPLADPAEPPPPERSSAVAR